MWQRRLSRTPEFGQVVDKQRPRCSVDGKGPGVAGNLSGSGLELFFGAVGYLGKGLGVSDGQVG